MMKQLLPTTGMLAWESSSVLDGIPILSSSMQSSLVLSSSVADAMVAEMIMHATNVLGLSPIVPLVVPPGSHVFVDSGSGSSCLASSDEESTCSAGPSQVCLTRLRMDWRVIGGIGCAAVVEATLVMVPLAGFLLTTERM